MRLDACDLVFEILVRVILLLLSAVLSMLCLFVPMVVRVFLRVLIFHAVSILVVLLRVVPLLLVLLPCHVFHVSSVPCPL